MTRSPALGTREQCFRNNVFALIQQSIHRNQTLQNPILLFITP